MATSDNPGRLVEAALSHCVALAETWIGWDGRPIVTDGANLWTPHKAARRVSDHLLDHLAEVEALLAGAETIPDTWHGRMKTFASDWAWFTELDVEETRSRWTRLGQLYVLRYAAAGPAEWDEPRTPNWTLREIAKHVANVTWYADQVGRLGGVSSAN